MSLKSKIGAALLGAAAFSGTASAQCVKVVGHEYDDLLAAKTVFVATILEARLVGKSSELRDFEHYRIDYTFEVRELLFGDPDTVRTLYSVRRYNAPEAREFHAAEQTLLAPGDSVLVVADEAEEQLALCMPSHALNRQELRKVRDVLGIP